MNLTHGGNLFAIAEHQGWDWRDVLDFSANINPLGPSPGVSEAIVQALDRIVHYPEREPQGLRVVLAKVWGIEPENILLGNGATELISFLGSQYHDAPCTLHVPFFSEFQRAFPDAQIAEKLPASGLVVVTRPANPTGELLCEEWLRTTKQPVVVDESFIEFAEARSLVGLVESRPNLFVLRSLTKFYALPGLRVGALVSAKETIQRWREVRFPWQVNVLASQAAIAAVSDTEHAARSVAFVSEERAWLFEQLSKLPGVQLQRSQANFIYVRLDGSAEQLCQYLLSRKILVRNCAVWPGLEREAVRVAVRTRNENMRLLKAWNEYRTDWRR